MLARPSVPLLVVLAAVAVAGCGGSPSTGALQGSTAGAVTLPRHKPAPVVPAKKLIRRARAFCRKVNAQSRRWGGAVPFDPGNEDSLLHAKDVWMQRWVVHLHATYRHFHALGIPAGGTTRHRWIGFLSQFKAMIDHFDELQAGNESLDGYYAFQSYRQLRKAAAAWTRRGDRLGLHVCVS